MKFGQFSDDSPEEIVVQLDLLSSLERNVVELSPQRVCKSVDRFVVENRNSLSKFGMIGATNSCSRNEISRSISADPTSKKSFSKM